MTASAPKALWPGRTVPAGRPAGALWVLLLVAVLTALPCAGHAKAVEAQRGAQAAAAPTTVVGPSADSAADRPGTAHHGDRGPAPDRRHWTWCTADGTPPSHNNCSSHPYCGQDAQLPNPPPQPQPAAATRPAAPEALPRVLPAGLLVGPHPAPDLHELQVHRS
ncbi:hypothetical protein ACWGB8_30460 [Kitasatospora sp. NPDC054939]